MHNAKPGNHLKTIWWAILGRECTGKAWIKPTQWKNPLHEGPLNIVPCCRGSPCLSCKVDMADGMRYTGSKLSQSGVKNVLSLTGLQYRNEGAGLQVAIHPSLKSFNKTIRDGLFQKKYTPSLPPNGWQTRNSHGRGG